MPKNILIVDDERALADTLCAILAHAGYNAVKVYSPADAMELMRTRTIDLLVSDVVMPAMDGVELAIHTRRQYPRTRILLMSGNAATQHIVSQAERDGYRFELLAKPVFPTEMLAQIEWLLNRTAAQQRAATA